jgi:hypothetical protein
MFQQCHWRDALSRPYRSTHVEFRRDGRVTDAAHGLDDALYEACETTLALERAGDWAGAETWSRIASAIWQVMSSWSAWMEAAEASGVKH